MIIELTSIDEEGKSYSFNERSEEVDKAFTELIGSHPFTIQLDIKPMAETFYFTGKVQSAYFDTCSRCGHDIDVPLAGKINEIVMVEKERPRNTQVSQSRRSLDEDGPSVTYVRSSNFDLTAFLFEMMASAFDLYPKCEDQKKCGLQKHEVEPVEIKENKGHPGFAALKDFKTKH